MSQEYVFEFSGTKEDFLNKLGYFPNNMGQFYYFDDYIVKIIGDEIHFGVERAGHSGGQWFIPTITEQAGKIEFRGAIKYIGPKNSSNLTTAEGSKLKRFIKKLPEILFYVFVSPFVFIVVLLVEAYEVLKWLKRKITRAPSIKRTTKEEKLFDLMENYLGCVRK